MEESFPGEVNDFDDQIGADGNLDTNRSVEVNSFNRLYYEGLQQKLDREKAIVNHSTTKSELEAS